MTKRQWGLLALLVCVVAGLIGFVIDARHEPYSGPGLVPDVIPGRTLPPPVSSTAPLEHPATISGTLVDDAGRPVTRGDVYFSAVDKGWTPEETGGVPSGESAIAALDRRGRFRTREIQPGHYVVILQVRRLGSGLRGDDGSYEPYRILRVGRDEDLEVDLVGVRTGSVSVTVETGGLPRREVFVRSERVDGSPWSQDTLSGNVQGDTTTFDGLAAGDYRFVVEHPTIGKVYWPSTSRRAESSVLTVAGGSRIDDVVIRMPGPAVLTGRVTAADGRPLAGRKVSAGREIRSTPRGTFVEGLVTTTTDQSGRYRLEAPTGTYDVWVGPGALPGDCENVAVPTRTRLAAGEHVVRDLRAPLRATIRGTVRDASGARVRRASVWAQDLGTACGRSARTDDRGHYVVTGLRNRVEVTVADGRTDLLAAPPLRLSLRPGEVRTGVDAVIPAAGRATGRVVDAEGNPVAGVEVSAQSAVAPGDANPEFFTAMTAMTGVDGRFVLRSLPDLTYRLSLSFPYEGPTNIQPVAHYVTSAGVTTHDEAAAATFEVEPGVTTSGLDVVARIGGQISGRVVRPDGTPAPRGAVDLWAWTKDGWSLYGEGWADRRGRYRLVGLPPGAYRLEFWGGLAAYPTMFDLPEPLAVSIPLFLAQEERVLPDVVVPEVP